ncbi:MAG: GNAT family N-acetyltransferase [Acetatifactor sp.]|nr:GNAT family N-acetyltransferase [Acetatifactor sp.]
MKKEYSEIFNLCFPQFHMSHERFCSLLEKEKSTYFDFEENGQVAGFAIVDDYAIRLLCVAPQMQRKGIGTKLLADIEENLASKGYEKCLTGGVSSKMFIGAVEESWGFFEKNGYKSVGGCEEMLIRLKDFPKGDYVLHGHEIAEYGWFQGDMEEIRAAVAAVDESWVQYYTNPSNIYVGRVNGEIASFCQVDLNAQNYLTDAYGKVGMPGCVGTVPKFRNKGVALEMIANVTGYLKEKNMDISFIFYTGVARWYEKLGYETFLTEVFGVKELTNK